MEIETSALSDRNFSSYQTSITFGKVPATSVVYSWQRCILIGSFQLQFHNRVKLQC